MRVARLMQPQQLLQVELSRRGPEQVGPAHYVRDSLFGVVDHDRELVGVNTVRAVEHEVAAFPLQVAADSSLDSIVERNHGAARVEPLRPRHPGWRYTSTARSRIDRAFR